MPATPPTACAQRVLLPPRPSQDDKWTPLMFAARNGHPSTVQKLLAAGADPTLKSTVRAAAAEAREGAVIRRQGLGRGAALGPRPLPPAAACAPASGLA